MTGKAKTQIEDLISKSECARRLEVSPTMVSRYVKQGMPVTAEGRIRWSEAKAWHVANVVPSRSGSFASRQCARAQGGAKGRCAGRKPVEDERRAGQRSLLDHVIRQSAIVPDLLLSLGVRDMAAVAASAEVFVFLLFQCAGAIGHDAFDWESGDDHEPMPHIDLAALAARFEIPIQSTADIEAWKLAGGELTERADDWANYREG